MNIIDMICESATDTTPAPVPQKALVAAPKKRKSPTYKKTTIASVCRTNFALGLTDAEIHEILLALKVDKYTADKFWYINWYRNAESRKATKAA